jgi:putative hemolysin
MFDFEVKIAQNKEEIRRALRLRCEVFRIEMGGGLKQEGKAKLDSDIYDESSDHLIVIDKTKDRIVGTYRLILGSRVNKKLGFYSEKFFDIRNIKRLNNNHQILELGRSCIHKDYRYGPVINLLWNGIAKYIQDYNVRYLFGSVRLLTSKPTEVSMIFKFLKERFYAGPEFRVYTRPQTKFKGLNENVKIENPRKIFHDLPPLIKGYLRLGVLVCGLPAINPDLDSVVIFVLLDTEKIPSAYKKHYL